MRTAESKIGRLAARFALLTIVALLLAGLSAASAAASPQWRLTSLAPTSAAPGDTFTYRLQMDDVGDSHPDATAEPWTFTATLPPGLAPVSAFSILSEGWNCSSFTTTLSCEDTSDTSPLDLGFGSYYTNLIVEVEVEPGASGLLTSEFQLAGGGAPATSTVDPTTITSEAPAFGIDAFDLNATSNAAGALSTQAGGRPYEVVQEFDFNSVVAPVFSWYKGAPRPVKPTKDVIVDLPPGLVGNTANIPQCTIAELTSGEGAAPRPLCVPSSQIGSIMIRTDFAGEQMPILVNFGPFPLYNLVPTPDAPARFGFNAYGSVVTIEAGVRSSGDYGIRAVSSDVPTGLTVLGTSVSLWGVPSDPAHTPLRGCPGEEQIVNGGPRCASEAPQVSFWRNPTSCEEEGTGSVSRMSADSWFNPGVFDEATSASHLAPGYPYPPSEWGAPQGPSGCAKVPFKPTLEGQATTNAADSPSGLDLHLKVPQTCWSQRDTVCQSDLKEAAVTLPAGITLNPSSVSGLGACSTDQIGLLTPVGSSPIHFDESPAACPANSRLGTIDIETPLLKEPLEGSVYLAKQGENPFGSLLSIYLVAEGSGVVVKQAGEIEVGPGGQLTTVVRNAPQLPFSDLHVQLFGGTRAPLRTPSSCGTYTTQATLTPWSGNPAAVIGSDIAITGCGSGGFDPKLSAGTENPLAGATSPFALRLQRDDGTQELGGLRVTLPEGLLGYLKGVSYCPDSVLDAISDELGTGAAQEASPSCPASSQVGTVTAGAGAGPNPFYTSAGRAYYAGPYKGAPVSLAVVAPAVAGPFDLGSVVVRNAIYVDPLTSQLTVVSDPLPTALHGIPLDLRDVRVNINRDHFTLNPTSCDEMQVASTITSTQGATASPSQRFQLAGCERLGFKPRLSLKLKGATRRAGHPALTAVMRPRAGNANIERIQVALPHSEFLAQDHLDNICTRVQFAADECPKGSVYGTVTATSPILDYPLYGKVYLRSSNHPVPDMVLKLQGPPSQPIEIVAVGRIDTDKKTEGIRTTFENLPDAPLTKVVLRMRGGEKSLLENSTDICRGTHRAKVKMDAHNGKFHDFRSALQVACGGAKRRRG